MHLAAQVVKAKVGIQTSYNKKTHYILFRAAGGLPSQRSCQTSITKVSHRGAIASYLKHLTVEHFVTFSQLEEKEAVVGESENEWAGKSKIDGLEPALIHFYACLTVQL